MMASQKEDVNADPLSNNLHFHDYSRVLLVGLGNRTVGFVSTRLGSRIIANVDVR